MSSGPILFEGRAYAMRLKKTGEIARIGIFSPFLMWAKPEDKDDPDANYETVRVKVIVEADPPRKRKRKEPR